MPLQIDNIKINQGFGHKQSKTLILQQKKQT
jgi:hypothetical protein